MNELQKKLDVFINEKETSAYIPGEIKYFIFKLNGLVYAFSNIEFDSPRMVTNENKAELQILFFNQKNKIENSFVQEFEKGEVNLYYYRELDFEIKGSPPPSFNTTSQNIQITVTVDSESQANSIKKRSYFYCLQRKGEHPVLILHDDYKETVREIFKDCPQIEAAMKRNFSYQEIRQYVRFYNKWIKEQDLNL